jgi:hypothetical protein
MSGEGGRVEVETHDLHIRHYASSWPVRRWLARFGALAALAIVSGQGITVVPLLWLMTMTCLLTFGALLVREAMRAWRGPAAFTVTTRALTMMHAREESLAASEIEEGWHEGLACELFARDGRRMTFPLHHPSDAGVLDALASPPRASAWRLPIHAARPWAYDAVIAAVLLAPVLGWMVDADLALTNAVALLPALVVAVSARVMHGVRPIGELTIGADGVRIARGASVRFVSFSEVRSIELAPRGFRMLLQGKRPVRVYLVPSRLRHLWRQGGGRDFLAEQRLRRALPLLEQRLAAFRAARGGSARMPQREAGTVDEWRATIDQALEGDGVSYRDGGLSALDAAALAEDPRAPASQRIGVALALSSVPDRQVRDRLRVAADLCADDELRLALDEAADGELLPSSVARYAPAALSSASAARQPPPPASRRA